MLEDAVLEELKALPVNAAFVKRRPDGTQAEVRGAVVLCLWGLVKDEEADEDAMADVCFVSLGMTDAAAGHLAAARPMAILQDA
jgi:hypothetical protein